MKACKNDLYIPLISNSYAHTLSLSFSSTPIGLKLDCINWQELQLGAYCLLSFASPFSSISPAFSLHSQPILNELHNFCHTTTLGKLHINVIRWSASPACQKLLWKQNLHSSRVVSWEFIVVGSKRGGSRGQWKSAIDSKSHPCCKNEENKRTSPMSPSPLCTASISHTICCD